MVLCIDIGNTRIKGRYFGEGSSEVSAVFTYDKENISALAEKLRAHFTALPDNVVCSSVVPALHDVIDSFSAEICGKKAIFISGRSKLNYSLTYDDPGAIGSDRVCAAAGAVAMYPGRDLCVADFGTALTFGLILREGVFEGGAIVPGAATASEALAQKGARLFTIEIRKPDRIAARNTNDALASGLYYGWLSIVSGMKTLYEKEYGRIFELIITGGGAESFLADLDYTAYEKDLVIKGLYELYLLNRA